MLLMWPHFQKERYYPFGFYIQNKIMLMDVREKTDDEKKNLRHDGRNFPDLNERVKSKARTRSKRENFIEAFRKAHWKTSTLSTFQANN